MVTKREDRQTVPPPSAHVRVVATWLAIFPMVSLGLYAVAPWSKNWPPILSAFLLTIVIVPLSVYFIVPKIIQIYGIFFTRRKNLSKQDGGKLDKNP